MDNIIHDDRCSCPRCSGVESDDQPVYDVEASVDKLQSRNELLEKCIQEFVDNWDSINSTQEEAMAERFQMILENKHWGIR